MTCGEAPQLPCIWQLRLWTHKVPTGDEQTAGGYELHFAELTLQSPVVTIGTTTFCMHLRTNSDYFPIQH